MSLQEIQISGACCAMVVLLDASRQSVPLKLNKEFQKLRGIRCATVTKRLRLLRISAAKGDPTSQIAKSSGTWPESISTFFQTTRINESSRIKEVDIISGNGGNNVPPPETAYSGDGDGSEKTELEPAELLNLAEVCHLFMCCFTQIA